MTDDCPRVPPCSTIGFHSGDHTGADLLDVVGAGSSCVAGVPPFIFGAVEESERHDPRVCALSMYRDALGIAERLRLALPAPVIRGDETEEGATE